MSPSLGACSRYTAQMTPISLMLVFVPFPSCLETRLFSLN